MFDRHERRSLDDDKLQLLELHSLPAGFNRTLADRPPFERDYRGEYTPYREIDSESSFAPPRLRRTVRRPFIVNLGDSLHRMEDCYREGKPMYRRRWYHTVGCSVFDGICINQDDFEEIDCASCIRSTFECFIKGCSHKEFYVDRHGTRRCTSCKIELGQDEDPDIYEEDDFREADDPPERDDPEMFLNLPREETYRKWNIERRFNQAR